MPKTAAPDGPGQRVAVLSRTTIELREQLEQAASLSGRSLSQEVEKRLEQTFDLDYLMGNGETALVMRTIGTAIRRFEVSSGKQWTADDATQEAAYEAAKAIIEVIMKPRPVVKEGLTFYQADDAYTRRGLQNMAIDSAMVSLRDYRNRKESEAVDLRPSSPQVGTSSE
jgi:hypothetical protein